MASEASANLISHVQQLDIELLTRDVLVRIDVEVVSLEVLQEFHIVLV